MRKWIKNFGKSPPKLKQVKVILRNGIESAKYTAAGDHRWRIEANMFDIIFYKIKKEKK